MLIKISHTIVFVLTVFACTVSAQTTQKNFNGTWTMNNAGQQAELTIKRNGISINGSLTMDGKSHTISGQVYRDKQNDVMKFKCNYNNFTHEYTACLLDPVPAMKDKITKIMSGLFTSYTGQQSWIAYKIKKTKETTFTPQADKLNI